MVILYGFPEGVWRMLSFRGASSIHICISIFRFCVTANPVEPDRAFSGLFPMIRQPARFAGRGGRSNAGRSMKMPPPEERSAVTQAAHRFKT
jgi:hypothetical protein